MLEHSQEGMSSGSNVKSDLQYSCSQVVYAILDHLHDWSRQRAKQVISKNLNPRHSKIPNIGRLKW